MISLPSGRVVLARHATPSGEIQLQQRSLPDGSLAFEIIADGVFLMASYNQVSERALARYALAAVQTEPDSGLRVLVAGLGMGFTLQETLSHMITSSKISDEDAVDVVEISAHIIAWNRTRFAPLNGQALADPRVRLIQDNLYNFLYAAPPASYKAILLDVDNGPSWLAYENNVRLYTGQALERWAALLAPGGVFAIWAAQPEPAFLKDMQVYFHQAEEIAIAAPEQTQKPVDNFIYQGLAY